MHTINRTLLENIVNSGEADYIVQLLENISDSLENIENELYEGEMGAYGRKMKRLQNQFDTVSRKKRKEFAQNAAKKPSLESINSSIEHHEAHLDDAKFWNHKKNIDFHQNELQKLHALKAQHYGK